MAEKKNKKEIKKEVQKEELVEDTSYGKTILACVLILIVLVVGYLSYKKIYDNRLAKNKQKEIEVKLTDDEKKFKTEYESLNGTILSDGEKLKKVVVVDDNNVIYVNLVKAVEMMSNDSGVFFFGYATDNMTRIVTPLLLDAMQSTSLEKIYYVSVRENESEESDFRDVYTLDKKKVKMTKEGKVGYDELLTILDEYLPKYTLVNADGKIVNTGEKRLQVPTVVAILDGKVVAYVEGTVENHELDSNGVLRDLTDKEKDEITLKYTDLITKYLNDDCDIEKKDEDC